MRASIVASKDGGRIVYHWMRRAHVDGGNELRSRAWIVLLCGSSFLGGT